MRLLAFADFVGLSLLEFLGFASIPVFDRAIVTRDTGIDFGFFSTNRDTTISITRNQKHETCQYIGEIVQILNNELCYPREIP